MKDGRETKALKRMATIIANKIKVKDLRNEEHWVIASDELKKRLERIIFAGFETMNYGISYRNDIGQVRAILDCTEFNAILVSYDLLPPTMELQSYESIYLPMKKVWEHWNDFKPEDYTI